MSESALPRPPFDPAYKLAGGMPGGMDISDLDTVRKALDTTSAQDILNAHPNLKHRDILVPAYEKSGSNVPLTIFEDKQSTNQARAALLYIHGGGQVAGTRFAFVNEFIRLMFPIQNDTVLAAVEYRLAPEHPAPAGAYDCYAALLYLEAHAKELGIDPKRTMVYGMSGGAPLASATCLLARKNGYPHIRAQILSIPMMDDRDHWSSHQQFETGTIWPGQTRQIERLGV
ncbi:hypothetical protein NX059_007765 [Plenodomus lindquistii]|nr:hypothetical protein NX059_007765 [Plenodomus lindquistii]